jgi:hypothetical protein
MHITCAARVAFDRRSPHVHCCSGAGVRARHVVTAAVLSARRDLIDACISRRASYSYRRTVTTRLLLRDMFMSASYATPPGGSTVAARVDHCSLLKKCWDASCDMTRDTDGFPRLVAEKINRDRPYMA